MNKIVNTKTNVLFSVEKVKNNSVPKHFFTDAAKKKTIKIGDITTTVMMNSERTQYVAFQMEEVDSTGKKFTQSYYVRDHTFFEGDKYAEVARPIKVVKQSGEVKEVQQIKA